MNDDRRQILDMLSQGKITTDEAERLLAALGRTGASAGSEPQRLANRAKYLRVSVDTDEEGDGMPRLFEFAFGLDPTLAEPLPVASFPSASQPGEVRVEFAPVPERGRYARVYPQWSADRRVPHK